MSHIRGSVGDCREALSELEDNSIDAVVTDPPYGLSKQPDVADVLTHWLAGDDYEHTGGGFMGKTWDSFVPGPATWREVYRVLKPGGHAVVFAGTRTMDLMGMSLRMAGFEVRDCLSWMYATGFPKSLNVSKHVRKKLCPSHESAPTVVPLSAPIPVGSSEGKELTALMLAQTLPEGGLAVITGTGEGDAFSAQTVTLLSESMGTMCSNIVSSWRSISNVSSEATSMFITETVTSLTTDWATWRSCLLPITHPTITPVQTNPHGCSCRVLPVVQMSDDAEPSTSPTRALIATDPVTSKLVALEGLGSSLKPAYEPILLVRKPFKGTVAANVLAHGTGALNIDATRISTDDDDAGNSWKRDGSAGEYVQPSGRWPANVMLSHDEECVQAGVTVIPGDRRAGTDAVGDRSRHSGFVDTGSDKGGPLPQGPVYADEEIAVWTCTDGCPVRLLDEQTIGVGGWYGRDTTKEGRQGAIWGGADDGSTRVEYGDSGGASRFFYSSKAAKSERNAGLDKDKYPKGNPHPTVKPVAVMEWLVRMVTPPGGTVLDPFGGSGTTMVACVNEGFDGIYIDLDEEYLDIAKARVAHAKAAMEEGGES